MYQLTIGWITHIQQCFVTVFVMFHAHSIVQCAQNNLRTAPKRPILIFDQVLKWRCSWKRILKKMTNDVNACTCREHLIWTSCSFRVDKGFVDNSILLFNCSRPNHYSPWPRLNQSWKYVFQSISELRSWRRLVNK